jgi:LmbE family N-acetylglucosaminyl deacetylase
MNVLAIGAHHDDIELGCGGTLARLARQGHSTFGLVLTNSETHYDIRSIHRTTYEAKAEAELAAAVIGMTLVEWTDAERDNGTLVYDVDLMRRIEQFIVDKSISMVFSHWQMDLNTDHQAAAKMTIVAARHVPSVLMYRSNWYQPSLPFNGTCVVDISDVIELKKRSLACYQKEIDNRSQQWIDTFIDSHRTAGFAFGRQYAEMFEPIRAELLGW